MLLVFGERFVTVMYIATTAPSPPEVDAGLLYEDPVVKNIGAKFLYLFR